MRDLVNKPTTNPVWAVILLCGAVFSVGCNSYTEISPSAYQLATALYSACNLGDPTRLERISELNQEAFTNSQISQQEFDWIDQIVSQASAGQWKAATDDSRLLLEAQVAAR